MSTTTVISKEHKRWRCMKAKGILRHLNDMSTKTCQHCSDTRSAGDKAENSNGTAIGVLERVDADGTEHWSYYDESTPRKKNKPAVAEGK
ncbi:hypothetical protein ACHAPU_000967 [Fusarium lateritium]